MRETELKLIVPAQSLEPVRRALRASKVSKKHLQAIYFDTGDWRLAEHGASLRLRREGQRWVQTAKANTSDVMHRLEQNIPVAAGAQEPRVDPMRHVGTPVGRVLQAALGPRRMRAGGTGLSARFKTDIVRTKRKVRTAGAEVEIALDMGTIAAGDRVLPVCELELELKSGHASELALLASQWVGRHGLWLGVESKADRGRALAQEGDESESVKAEPPDVTASVEGSAFLAATLESCLTQVLKNASRVAEDHASEKVVHQLRVGLRRLRTALRELEDMATGTRPEWEPVLREVFQELGRYRDQSVVLAALRRQLEAIAGPQIPDPKPTQKIRPPATLVREGSFQITLLELMAFAPKQTQRASIRAHGLHDLLVDRLDHLLRRIRRDAKRFDQLDVAKQHRVRKRLKRLRYLSEFAAPIFGPAKVARYLKAWKKAQEALGRYNDPRIAIDLLRGSANGHEEGTSFALGWLQAQKRRSTHRCAKALADAVDVEPFWASRSS